MRQKAEPITVEAKVTSVGLDEVLEKAHRLQEILSICILLSLLLGYWHTL